MGLPFAAQLGISLAPTIIGGLGRAFRSNKPTSYEKRIRRIADVLEEDAAAPLTENRFFQEGSAQLERQTDRRRERSANRSAATGGTNEQRLAETDQINEAEQEQQLRLLSGAERFRKHARSRFLNAIGLLESARQNRNYQYSQDLNRIVQPVSAASRAFLLSDMFSGEPEGGAAEDELQTAGGFEHPRTIADNYDPSRYLTG